MSTPSLASITPSIPVQISQVSPDYEQILSQLLNNLSNSVPWQDLITASTGRLLLNYIAQIGAYGQFSIQQALIESNFNARLPSSIYELVRMLGNHLQRMKPGEVNVTLTRNTLIGTVLQIPAYTQFICAGIKLFNRVTILFGITDISLNVSLYEGALQGQNFLSDGSVFQNFKLSSGTPFNISDTDILCTVGGISYNRIIDGLWHYGPKDNIFYENTLADGSVEVLFGNNIYGSVPSVGQMINFIYTITSGLSGNQSLTGTTIVCPQYTTVTGIANTSIYNGEDAPGLDFWRYVGPNLYAARTRGINRSDIRAIILTYGGVIDCLVRSQAEMGPEEITWMNVISLTILTEQVWTTTQWNEFTAWLLPQCCATIQFARIDPQEVVTNINVSVFSFPPSSTSTVQTIIINAITDLFKLSIGSIGKSVFQSDIQNAIMRSFPANTIDYLEIITPVDTPVNIFVTPTQYVTLGTLSVNVQYTDRMAPV